jgi:hypothetical protein
LIPLLDSVTLAQAAVLAAICEILLTLYYTVTLLPALSSTAPASSLAAVVLGAVLPSLVWAGFFFVVYRELTGRRGFLTIREAAWIALILGIGLQVAFVNIPFERAMVVFTPLGAVRRIGGWMLRIGWAVFLILFARIPGHLRTRRLALLLAILSAPSALSAAYDAFNNGVGFLFADMPTQALWRALITPVIQTVYWLSQILFLWTVWGNPEPAGSVEATSARLAP